MASPTVQGGTNTARTVVETSSPVNMPAATVAKELLIMHGRVCGVGAITVPGFTQLAQDSSDASDDVEYVGWKQATGSEGGTTVTVTHGNFRSAWVVTRIQGADLPTVNPPVISTVAVGATNVPNPNSLTPSYGSRDYLWLWLGGWEGEQTNPPATAPTNYTIINNAATGTTGNTDTNCRIADYRRATTGTVEDPPAVTISAAAVGWTAWTVAVTNPINQTVTLGLITNSPSTFSLSPQNQVTVGLITQTGATFSPTVTHRVELGLITQTGTTFAPEAIPSGGSQTVTITALLDQTGVTFSPSVRLNVTVGLISSVGTTFSPTVTNRVTVGLITQTAATFSPTVRNNVVLGLISSVGSTFAPTLVSAITVGFINNTGTVFTPTSLIQNQIVTVALISSTGSTFSPTVRNNVVLGLISSVGSTFAPTITNRVTLGLISSVGSTFSPSISNRVTLGLITNTTSTFSPTLRNNVVLALINNSYQIFAPAAFGGQQISPDLINQTGTVFSLTVTGRVVLPLVSNTLQVFAPNLVRAISLGLIPATTAVYAPVTNQAVVLGQLTNPSVVFAPVLQHSITIQLITNSGQVFSVTLPITIPIPDYLLIAVSRSGIEREASYGLPGVLTGVGRKDTERWASSGEDTRLTAERSV